MPEPPEHDTAPDSSYCWCDPIVLDFIDGLRTILHRPAPTHVLPGQEGSA